MKALTIWKDDAIGFYSISIDGEVKYECLAADEVAEVVSEIMEGEEER